MEFKTIALDLIDPHPMNPRESLTDLDSLSASIAELGVLQPVLLRVNPLDAARFQLEAGHRRTEAARMAGLAEIPAALADGDDDTAFLNLLATQKQHVPFTAAEEARGLQGILSLGNVERSGKALGIDPDLIKRAQRGRTIVDKSKLEQASFEELAALVEFEGTPELHELEKAIGKGQFSWKVTELRQVRAGRLQDDRLRGLGLTMLETAPSTGKMMTRCDHMRGADGEPVDQKQCETCPAALVAPTYSFSSCGRNPLTIYCDGEKRVDGHVSIYGAGETEEERAEREREEQEREAKEAARIAASEVRVTFCREISSNTAPDAVNRLLIFVSDFAQEHGLQKEDDDTQAMGDTPAQVLFALAVDACESAVAQLRYLGDWYITNFGTTVRVYFEFLSAMGYELNPPELELIAALDAKPAAPETEDDCAGCDCYDEDEGCTFDGEGCVKDAPASELEAEQNVESEPAADALPAASSATEVTVEPEPEVDFSDPKIGAAYRVEAEQTAKALKETTDHAPQRFHWGGIELYAVTLIDGKLTASVDTRRPTYLALEDLDALIEELGMASAGYESTGTLPGDGCAYSIIEAVLS